MDLDLKSDDSSVVSDKWVKLNVGGTLFVTTKLTLTRDPRSFLCRICDVDSGLTSSKDDNGAYLVDRDPTYFRPVLNYLRHGKLIVDEGLSLQGILEEAEFYNLTGLIEMMKVKTAQSRPQYKVATCWDSSMASSCIQNMAPGWKLEQLVSLKDDGGDSYFLVVTSKTATSSS